MSRPAREFLQDAGKKAELLHCADVIAQNMGIDGAVAIQQKSIGIRSKHPGRCLFHSLVLRQLRLRTLIIIRYADVYEIAVRYPASNLTLSRKRFQHVLFKGKALREVA